MRKIMLPLLCLFFLGASCQKDDAPKTAPPITQENAFSCKINGVLFIPEDHYHGFNPAAGIRSYILLDNSWSFRLADKRRDLYIYLYNVTATGEYIVTASDGNHDFFGEIENQAEMTDHYVPGATYVSVNNNEKIEVLELELDTRIILQFDSITLVSDTDPEDVIVLTEGKLNINLETLAY